jgi:hypothetical protein
MPRRIAFAVIPNNVRDPEQPAAIRKFKCMHRSTGASRFRCVRITFHMEKASEILSAAMRQMRQPEATIAWLAGTWASIVGDQIAAHTRPVALTGGLLEIRTSGTDWQKQLEGMASEFRDKINRAWGGRLVHELCFATAMPSAGTVSKEEDNQHTPFVRKRTDFGNR